jgi:hypothetical protein
MEPVFIVVRILTQLVMLDTPDFDQYYEQFLSVETFEPGTLNPESSSLGLNKSTLPDNV